MMHTALVTFDVDWAPEWAISLCADLCAAAGVPATFFSTHRSDVLRELASDRRFEVGIHPNLLPGSSHGGGVEEVMRACLAFAPDARAMRTHGLAQWSPFFDAVGSHFRQIDTDMSLFLPFHPGVQPVDYFIGEPGRRLVRLPYHWEDDVAAAWPGWNWDSPPVVDEGLAAFDFHPMLVALNLDGLKRYRELKRHQVGRHLADLTPADVAPYVHQGAGARTYLEALLGALAGRPASTASAAAAQWVRECPVPGWR